MMANVTLKATSRFSTSITVGGKQLWQAWAEGDVRPVPENVAALLMREVPGCSEVVKAKKIEVVKAAKKSVPKIETKAGTNGSSTRQVTAAPKRKTTKKAAKK